MRNRGQLVSGELLFEQRDVNAVFCRSGKVMFRSFESADCDTHFNGSKDAQLEVYMRYIMPTLDAADALVDSDDVARGFWA